MFKHRKVLWAAGLASIAVLLIGWVVSACPPPVTLSATGGCEHMTVTGTYVPTEYAIGHSITMWIDNGPGGVGTDTKYYGSESVSVSHTITTPGTYSVKVGGFEFNYETGWNWILVKEVVLEVTVVSCSPPTPSASASVSVGQCSYSQENGSQSPASFTVDGAVIHAPSGDITASETVNLPPGHYEWTWDAAAGYQGSGTLTFDVGDCTPIPHDVVLHHNATCGVNNQPGTWSFGIDAGDAAAVPNGPTSGVWQDSSNKPEAASIVWEATWPDGYQQSYSDSVSKPSDCSVPPPEVPVIPTCKDEPCVRKDIKVLPGQCVAVTFIAEAGCAWNSKTGKCETGRSQLRIVCNEANSAVFTTRGKLFQTEPVPGVDQPGMSQLDIGPNDYTPVWYWIKWGSSIQQFWKDPLNFWFIKWPYTNHWWIVCTQPIYYTIDNNQILLQAGQPRREAVIYVVETAWGVSKDDPNYGCYWNKAAKWADGLVGPKLSDFNKLPIPAKPTDCGQ